jgi:hypothetical protein
VLCHCISCKYLNYCPGSSSSNLCSWNSAVFSTLESNQYDILLVSSDFINSDSFNCKLDNVIQPGGTGKGNMDNDTFCDFAKGLYDANKAGNLQYLDNLACMKAYSVDLLEGRRNLLAVSKDTGDNHAEGTDLQNGSIFGWMPSSNYQWVFSEHLLPLLCNR